LERGGVARFRELRKEKEKEREREGKSGKERQRENQRKEERGEMKIALRHRLNTNRFCGRKCATPQISPFH